MTTPGLVIFDCDGVVVDSEMLSAGLLMGMMADLGLPITLDIFRDDFLGRSFAVSAQKCIERFGVALPADFEPRYRAQLFPLMRAELQPMAGVEQVLAALKVPYCLATSSGPERLAASLEGAGLQDWFEDRCFLAHMVAHPKPAPDLFVFAAAQMGVVPEACVVIEDSEMGVRAGLAAGMVVWQFQGGAHMKAGYHLPDDVTPHRVIATMPELQQAFAALGIC
jgi:HAD superfamily hydrolase (TIGR01509 family)